MYELDDKSVLITGAAGSLGQAVVRAFSACGARIAALDIDAEALRQKFGQDGPACMTVAADLGDSGAVDRAVAAVVEARGQIDVLCNIAGGFAMGPAVHETSDESWRHMIELNAGSVLRTARAVVPIMLQAESGKIVNVGAMGGLAGRPNMAAYSAAKSAVIRLTESLSAELRDKGINVNCVLPSIIDTPANRAAMPDGDPRTWVAPEALADVIVFLASNSARAVHGVALPVVGLS